MKSTSLAQAKNQLAERRQALAEQFRRDLQPAGYLSSHTRLVDDLIQSRAQALISADISLFAIAGYGRTRLFPHSDIDLLVVLPSSGNQEVELKEFFREIWDAGLRLSQQVCSLEDLKALGSEDWEFILAIQDLRPLFGPRALAQEVYQRKRAFEGEQKCELLVSRVLDSVRARQQSFDGTIYHLEPDLKKGPGGLRDLHVLQLIHRLKGLESPLKDSKLQEAQSFLSQLRICLHLLTGRDQNRLTHALQEQVAGMLRSSPLTSLAVESLMGDYFGRARLVDTRVRRVLRGAFGEAGDLPAESSPVPIFQGFLHFLEYACGELREGQGIDPELLDSVHRQVGGLARGVIHPLLSQGILELFYPRPGLYLVLRELHDAGLLAALFPEFESIQSRVVRDFYHRYTVDEHSLRAVRVCEELSQLTSSPDRRFTALLEEVNEPVILTLSLLLHDVGKGQGGGHSEKGASMAASAMARFRFAPGLVHEVGFLIRNHLAMSSLIQKRDLSDESVVGQFADRVGNVERLRLLCLHTYCDISAVSPDAMSQWRKDRLWQLYLSTYYQLTREYGRYRVAEPDDLLGLVGELPSELDTAEFENFLVGIPRRYLVSTPWEEIYQHFRLAQAVSDKEPVQVELKEDENHWRLNVVTRDQRRLFARIAGLISYFEMSIGKGHGFSNRAGLVLDSFEFSDPRGMLKPRGEKERFLKMLQAALADQLSVKDLLQRKEQSVIFRSPSPEFDPLLTFHEPGEGDYTILELVAPDSLGLLYRIATQLAHLRCNIELVLINTEGHRAIDVFYLTYRGKRLNDERKGRLQEAVREAIGQPK